MSTMFLRLDLWLDPLKERQALRSPKPTTHHKIHNNARRTTPATPNTLETPTPKMASFLAYSGS